MIPRAYLVRIAPWWVLCVIIGSFLPGSSKEALGTANSPAAIAQGHVATKHRLAHFVTFGSTALLVVVIAETASEQLAAGLAVAALGLLIECTQYAVTGVSEMEWWDVRDDALAAIGTLLLAQCLNLRGLIVRSRRGTGSPNRAQ
ncbi:MAG: hypothetical protein ACJ746_11295 [Bryobacteraceae bacterium]